eukprot:scaffold170436_cov33-Prasinocladus_malaysianus.AAC.2
MYSRVLLASVPNYGDVSYDSNGPGRMPDICAQEQQLPARSEDSTDALVSRGRGIDHEPL